MMIDVYVLNLSCFDEKKALAILPDKIVNDALRLKLERKRIEYIASQWLRYKLLSEFIGVHVKELVFAETKTGRPFLKGEMVDFNISHTRNYAVIAIAKAQRIGIDVQTKKEKIDVLAIAKQYFAMSEYELIASRLDGPLRRNVFYWLWAYKEATLKLTGEGIAHGLDRYVFDVNEEGECKSTNVKDKCYFHQHLDENTLMCLSFEETKSKVKLHFL